MSSLVFLMLLAQADPAARAEAAPASAAPAVDAPAVPWTAERALVALQARYDTVTDLSADFSQTAVKAATGVTTERSGRLFLKRPGKMRFDYAAPDRMFYVSDGQTLIQYLPQDQLVYRMRVEGSSLAGPFRFLVGGGRVAEEFEPVSLSEAETQLTLQVRPRRDHAGYAELTLRIDKASFDVVALEILDPLGNSNHIQLSAVKHEPLPDGGFDVSIPEGVRVQDL
jgi:outer membrane lipoprotein carrier protein